MNMKKLIALAVAAAVMSPMAAMAANTPDNVGDVTLLGNIVANSPMWQWTVNDYPGPRLDAKPSAATTANGKTTYPLAGQPFIAVSGYLPSMVGINTGSVSSNLGTRDITQLTDQTGAPPANVTDALKGAVTFTIAATGIDSSGSSAQGVLTLKATEVRGYRGAWSYNGTIYKRTGVFGSDTYQPPVYPGSCFVGTGTHVPSAIISGSADNPTSESFTANSWNNFVSALIAADGEGTAPKFESIDSDNATTVTRSFGCSAWTLQYLHTESSRSYSYLSAAHVLELTPVSLTFSTPVQGAWNSTLTVTAYQM